MPTAMRVSLVSSIVPKTMRQLVELCGVQHQSEHERVEALESVLCQYGQSFACDEG
jgi:hypothetical protein